MKRILCGLAATVLGGMWCETAVLAQDTLHSPLPIPLKFSGNFGEIRTGHFHTGLDIRTEGREGIPVLAAQDGRVSRVKVSSRGYGLALYLNGGGLTTVYAHLSRFHPEVEKWLMHRQYQAERWAFDAAPDTAFRFAAGDTLGWSGNSGGSFGPHLHFEVRSAQTQYPINPLHWSFKGAGVTDDQVPPEFRGIWVVPEPGSAVEGQPERFRWTAAYAEGLRVAGPFSMGVEGFDRLDGERFTHGPYGLDVWFGDSLVHSHRMDTLSFQTNSDVSAHIDLPAWQDRKGRVHRLQRLPGNRLDIYRRACGKSPWTVPPGDSVRVEARLLDIRGNETRAEMWLWGEQVVATSDSLNPIPLEHNRAHVLQAEGMTVALPANALYGDASIELGRDDQGAFRVWSEARITRHDYTLTVPVDSAFVGSGSALVLCGLDAEGEVSGTWVSDERQGQLQVKLDRFGTFEVRSDSVPPVFGKPRLSEGKITLSMADELTGIDRWEGRCGDQWMRWSLDKGVLTYRLSDGILDGREQDEIKVWAIDAAGNLGHCEFSLEAIRR